MTGLDDPRAVRLENVFVVEDVHLRFFMQTFRVLQIIFWLGVGRPEGGVPKTHKKFVILRIF